MHELLKCPQLFCDSHISLFDLSYSLSLKRKKINKVALSRTATRRHGGGQEMCEHQSPLSESDETEVGYGERMGKTARNTRVWKQQISRWEGTILSEMEEKNQWQRQRLVANHANVSFLQSILH